MQDVKRITASLNRLLATFPPFGSGDPRTALQVYHEVISEFDDAVIDHVVSLFIAGKVEGQSLTFLPTAPMFAAQLRKARDAGYSDLFSRAAVRQIEARDNDIKGQVDEPTRKQIVTRALARATFIPKEDRPPPPRTPEELAQVAAKMQGHDEMFGLSNSTDDEIRRRLGLGKEGRI